MSEKTVEFFVDVLESHVKSALRNLFDRLENEKRGSGVTIYDRCFAENGGDDWAAHEEQCEIIEKMGAKELAARLYLVHGVKLPIAIFEDF